MTFTVRFSAAARRHVDAAIAYYRVEAPAQARRFGAEVSTVARRLRSFPYVAPVLVGDTRRIPLRRFPYQCWYRVLADVQVVEVVAVLHHRQDQTPFIERLPNDH